MPAWNEEREGQLRELWKKGASASEIAIEMGGGLTRNAIIGKCHRLNLPMRVQRGKPVSKMKTPPKRKIRQPVQRVEPIPIIPDIPLSPSGPLGGVGLLELKEGLCRAVIGCQQGSNEAQNVSYCGGPAVENKSWCDYHLSLYTLPPRKI